MPIRNMHIDHFQFVIGVVGVYARNFAAVYFYVRRGDMLDYFFPVAVFITLQHLAENKGFPVIPFMLTASSGVLS